MIGETSTVGFRLAIRIVGRMQIHHRLVLVALALLPVACAGQSDLGPEMTSLLERAAGRYTGTNWLWFEDPENPEESATGIEVAANRISYTWEYRGEPQSGVMEFAFDGDAADMTWTDTWHAKEAIVCPGKRTDDRIEVVGTYGPGWSWRTEVTLATADEILVEMFNISPDGKEQIAVRMRGPRQ